MHFHSANVLKLNGMTYIHVHVSYYFQKLQVHHDISIYMGSSSASVLVILMISQVRVIFVEAMIIGINATIITC